jgi:anti-anti-sigma factor
MAVRLLQGFRRRSATKTVQVAADHGDSGPARDFSMTESRTDTGVVCLRLAGDIDLTCWDSLRNRLTAMTDIDHVDHLVVDLDEVTFLDCSGIGALITGYNAALVAGCRYEVRNPHGIVSTILRICGIDVALGIEPTASPDATSFAA